MIVFYSMKKLLLFLSLCWTSFSFAQTFHFEDTCTTLIKTTSQSPAHWYIEIFNDTGVDTMLRWKAYFEEIPAEWNINFDVQTQSWPTVNDGDSADFVLQPTAEFPQKLIIGAMLNDTPGNGTVFFDMYDPDFPSVRQTICYEFIVTSVVGLDELQEIPFIRSSENAILVTNGQETTLEAYALNGQRLVRQTSSDRFDLSGMSSQTVLLHLRQNGKRYIVRTFIR